MKKPECQKACGRLVLSVLWLGVAMQAGCSQSSGAEVGSEQLGEDLKSVSGWTCVVFGADMPDPHPHLQPKPLQPPEKWRVSYEVTNTGDYIKSSHSILFSIDKRGGMTPFGGAAGHTLTFVDYETGKNHIVSAGGMIVTPTGGGDIKVKIIAGEKGSKNYVEGELVLNPGKDPTARN